MNSFCNQAKSVFNLSIWRGYYCTLFPVRFQALFLPDNWRAHNQMFSLLDNGFPIDGLVCTKSCACTYDRHMHPRAILHPAPSFGPLRSANVYQSRAASGLSFAGPRALQNKGIHLICLRKYKVQYYLSRWER